MYSEEQIENAMLPSFGPESLKEDKIILTWVCRELADKLSFIGPEAIAWMKRADMAERQYAELYTAATDVDKTIDDVYKTYEVHQAERGN
jgi:hypothetical protein